MLCAWSLVLAHATGVIRTNTSAVGRANCSRDPLVFDGTPQLWDGVLVFDVEAFVAAPGTGQGPENLVSRRSFSVLVSFSMDSVVSSALVVTRASRTAFSLVTANAMFVQVVV